MFPVRQVVARALVAAAVVAGCGPRVTPAGPGETRVTARAARATAEGAALAKAEVVPRRYALELAIDPEATGYTGTVAIDVELSARTGTIWLDARDLRIDGATVTVGDEIVRATEVPEAPAGRLGLALAKPVGPGKARIEIRFAGDYRSDDGIFAQQYRGRGYVFSDFEPLDAQRGFPCFDEPRFKTPWTVSLVVPKGTVALGNGAVRRTTELKGGLQRVELVETAPLPTYLVAVAVGPFEIVEAEGGRVPVRIVVPSGRRTAAARAAAFAPELLETAAAWLERPVPFEKLDIVAVPRFGGAMENPGLVTVAGDILLDATDDRAQRKLALVLAHEIAHFWFGDSVTLGDWRDLWMNEGFASWMADEVLARWRPAWQTRRDEVRYRLEAMTEDDAPGAHALRPSTLDAPRALFDVITYQKSAAILHAIEDWVGPERFVAVLRGYLDTHASGTASTGDVIAAFDTLGTDVGDVLDGLLAAPGVPTIDAELSCTGPARLRLTPRHGGDAPRLPVCVRWHDGSAAHRACAIVDDEPVTLALGDGCPAWVHPNADGSGYYRWSLAPGAGRSIADAIAGGDATARERLDAALSIREALGRGTPLVDVARALRAAVRTEIPEVVEVAVGEYALLIDQLAPAGGRGAIAAHLREGLAPALRRVGTVPRPGEAAEDRRLRVVVLDAAGTLADDAAVIGWARKAARRWLDRPRRRSAAPELIEPALLVAAAHADERLAGRLLRAAETARDDVGVDAELLARALGRMPRARALRALDRALAGALPSVTTFALVTELIGRRDTATATLDALAGRGDWLAIALTFVSTCDPDLLARLADHAPADAGVTRAIERRRSEAQRCARLRPLAAGAARAFR